MILIIVQIRGRSSHKKNSERLHFMFIILSGNCYIVLNRKMKNYLSRKNDREMIALDCESIRKRKSSFSGKAVL